MEKKPQIKAAEKFLKKGTIGDYDGETLAGACESLILEVSRKSLKRALSLSRKYVERISERDKTLRMSAYRMLARSAHLSGLYDEARDAYLKVKRMAVRQPLVKAKIDRALIDIYMYLGDQGKAVKCANRAISIFKSHRLKADLIQTEINYANLLHRQDRHAEAEKLYGRGADYFSKTGNELAAARCYYNRANSLVQLFDFDRAERLYLNAKKIYDSENCILDATDARYGLAWMAMLGGEFHRALQELSECEKAYRDGGDPRGEALCSLDRVETFINLGLNRDALETARTVERRFKKLKMIYESSKAALFRAQAAQAAGIKREAQSALERAEGGFRQENNSGFLGITKLLKSESGKTDNGQSMKALTSARRYFSKAQLPLWEAVCDLRFAEKHNRPERWLRSLERNRAVHSVPHLFASWQMIMGDYLMDRGDTVAARRHWEKAADRLDRVRASMPPVELRSHYGRRVDSPHLRLIDYELRHDPARAAIWSEKYKTAGIWRPLRFGRSDAKRREAEESLADLARRVGAIARDIRLSGTKKGSTRSKASYLNGLQRNIREKILALEDFNGAAPDSEKTLSDIINKVSRIYPAIQFHQSEKDIIAFIHQDGNTDFVKIEGGVADFERLLERWRFAMEAVLISEQYNMPPIADIESKLWSEMGDRLGGVFSMISPNRGSILIIPEGLLSNIPWPAVVTEGRPLYEKYNLIESPSFRHFWNARTVDSGSSRVDIFRGASEGLTSTSSELDAIKQVMGNTVSLHEPCARNDWPSDGKAGIWHFAGHAEHRPDNPFYSSLFLEDGPLFAADFRLKNCSVDLVTLAACRTGEQLTLPGEESTGLVRSLLEMGARNVIAGRWEVSDQVTAIWMTNLYKSLHDGESLLDAIRKSADIIRSRYSSAYYWAAFAVWGAGDLGGKYEA